MARILVVFSSLFGANAELADHVASVLDAAGAETRIRRVREVALAADVQPGAEAAQWASADDLGWADGFVFSSPSHTGLASASIKAFIDQNHDAAVAGAYVDKTFTAMATSAFAHAGQERVVDDLNAVGAAWGCILVPPGTANATVNKLDGNPYGLSFVLDHGKLANVRTILDVLTEHLGRFVAVTDATTELRAPARSEPSSPSRRARRTPPPIAADALGVSRADSAEETADDKAGHKGPQKLED